MPRLITVALYHRDQFSHGNARRTFGHEAYHWGIMVIPQVGQEQGCCVFEATDTCDINPATFRMTNPTMDWRFRVKGNDDPTLTAKLIGRIVIGQVPDGVSSDELRDFLARVRLPVKNTNPQQSCVTWTGDAIQALQRQGWLREFDLDQFKDWALSYADERMNDPNSSEQSMRNYSA